MASNFGKLLPISVESEHIIVARNTLVGINPKSDPTTAGDRETVGRLE